MAEKLLVQLIERAGAKTPDPIIEAFDKAAFADPNLNLADFASDHAVERRRLERLVKKAYGQTPKQVLRRARSGHCRKSYRRGRFFGSGRDCAALH